MTRATIDEAYVRAAAAAVELEVPAERLQAVIENLQRIAVIAAPALDAALEAEDEIAPVWRL